MEKNTELEKLILTEIFKNPNFTRCEVPGISTGQGEFSGIFEAVFLLSDLHAWTELTDRKNFKIGKIKDEDDALVLSVLDKIAEQGKIFISRVEIAPDMSHRDIRFLAIIGEGKRTAGCSNVSTSFLRNFSIEPLSVKEKEKRKCLIDLSGIVKEIRKNRDESFQAMMGTPSDVSLMEQQKEALKSQKKAMESEEQFKRDIHDIAEWVRKEAD